MIVQQNCTHTLQGQHSTFVDSEIVNFAINNEVILSVATKTTIFQKRVSHFANSEKGSLRTRSMLLGYETDAETDAALVDVLQEILLFNDLPNDEHHMKALQLRCFELYQSERVCI